VKAKQLEDDHSKRSRLEELKAKKKLKPADGPTATPMMMTTSATNRPRLEDVVGNAMASFNRELQSAALEMEERMSQRLDETFDRFGANLSSTITNSLMEFAQMFMSSQQQQPWLETQAPRMNYSTPRIVSGSRSRSRSHEQQHRYGANHHEFSD